MTQEMPFEQAVLLFAQIHRGRRFERLAGLCEKEEVRADGQPEITNIAELRIYLHGLVKTDGGPGSGNFGHSGRPGQIGGSAKEGTAPANEASKQHTVSKELQPTGTGYSYDPDDGEDEFIQKNIKKLMPIYKEKGSDGITEEFFKVRMQNSTKDLHQIDEDTADSILYDNVSSSKVQQWFREYNYEVKPRLVCQLTSSPEVRNAALNIMYENYKFQCKYYDHQEPLDFDTFLITPVKMYRGGSGKERKDPNIFSSYTFSRKVAEQFTGSNVGQGAQLDPNGVVWEAEIRPIDTYGSIFANGEAEIMVPGCIAPNGNRDEEDIEQVDGGPGSGNFGHAGRPGKVGGSASQGSGVQQEAGKGNYLKYGDTVEDRNDYRLGLFDKYTEAFEKKRKVLAQTRKMYEQKKKIVEKYDQQEEKYSFLDEVESGAVTKEELSKRINGRLGKAKKLLDQYKALNWKTIANSTQEEVSELTEQAEMLKNYGKSISELAEIRKARKPLDEQIAPYKQSYEETRNNMQSIQDAYKKRLDAVNAEILSKYPSYDAITDSEDAGEYLNAKGYFQAKHGDEWRGYDSIAGEYDFSEGADIYDMDDDIAVSVVKKLDQVYNKYPDLKDMAASMTLESIHEDDLASFQEGDFMLREEFFGSKSKWGRFKPGSYVQIVSSDPYAEAVGTVVHEYGHALEDLLMRKYPKQCQPVAYKEAIHDSIAPVVFNAASKKLGMSIPAMQKSLSKYAEEDLIEAFAEAFCEYMTSDKPRPVAAEVGKQIDALYKTGSIIMED